MNNLTKMEDNYIIKVKNNDNDNNNNNKFKY